MRLKTLVLCSTSVLSLAAAPALAQTAPTPSGQPTDPAAAPVTTGDVTGGEEVVVTGLRRSLQSAQNIKRNADQQIDSVVAEDIG